MYANNHPKRLLQWGAYAPPRVLTAPSPVSLRFKPLDTGRWDEECSAGGSSRFRVVMGRPENRFGGFPRRGLARLTFGDFLPLIYHVDSQ